MPNTEPQNVEPADAKASTASSTEIAGDVWQPIAIAPSSNIAGVEWNAASKDLRIRFHREGRTYVYRGVDARTVEGMSQAASVGYFFDAFVKRQYEFEETT